MSALLNITEPNNNANSNDNDFLASLTTDAPQAIASKYRREQIAQLFDLPLMDLLLQAQTIHRQNFNANEVQISTLLSIKTGNCPEDCGYCSRAVHVRDKT